MEQFWNAILSWLRNLIGLDLMLSAMEEGRPIPAQAYLNLVFSSITLIVGILVAYRTLYMILGVFGRSRKYPSAPKDKRYCFIVPARNEELVIGNLIDTVRAMDYPQELVDIMVVADNCDDDDKTAEIARSKGAIVIERHDMAHRTLGFALQYAFREFKKQGHDIESEYYAYIRLDADNIVSRNYLTKLNDCMQNSNFDEAITYRNAKNLDENWIAAMCGMNVYVNVLANARPRSILKTNQQVYGPGACFRSYLLKDGWNWTGLTEDLDIESDITSRGYVTGYCEEAMFYEEEPTEIRLFVRQQMRWTRGNLISFGKYAPGLLKSFFKKPTWSKYDIFWQFFPYSFVSFYFTLAYQLISLVLFFIYGNNGYNWWSFGNWLLTMFGGIYVSNLLNDALTVIREWKRFHLSVPKTILYIFLFPIYQIINLPVSCVAGFMKVQWKHIDHHSVVDPATLEEEEARRAGKK
ncbi:MAG: glycosyltransferase family 2 protein [Bacilli bacterium]|nr:glycosyltransferase family 2 protein [Bacilli bacterium]